MTTTFWSPVESSRRDRVGAFAAVALAVVAAVPAAWWAIGDQSSKGFSRAELDYVIIPPDWSATTERAVGIGAIVVVVVSMLVFAVLVNERRVDRRWVRVVVVLLLDAAYLAYAARVATAGVIGANLGLFEVVLGGVVVGGVTAWGVVARTLTIVSERPGVESKLDRVFSHFR